MGPAGPPGPILGLDASAPALDGAADANGDASDAAAYPDEASSGAGLAGRVRDPSGSPVERGAIVLVPATRVAALASTPIDLSLSGAQAALATNDEPLEDTIAGDPALPRAALTRDGSFRFEGVPDGEQFVVYVPAADDALHLPGGQLARTPFAGEALRGGTLDLHVSGAPSERASYVGSGPCLGCHGRHSLFASAHALSVRVPGVSSPYQDVRQAPRVDEALAAFSAGIALYFVGCDASSSAPCEVRTSTPAPSVETVLAVRLGVDASLPAEAVGRYYVELSSRASAPQRYPLALTVGGTRSLQQYVARLALPGGGFTHVLLPFSYQLAGDASRADAMDQRWVAYRLADWVDLASGLLRTPEAQRAFERECAGCHATGFAARGSDSDGYRGSAVTDRDGIYDLDGDGRKELLAVGCEACHGPGSEHLEVAPRGQRIVSPRLLTPERDNLVCGVCHARQSGRHGEPAPLDDALRMPRAGVARAAFLAQHVGSLAVPESVFRSGDPRVSFAQYGDFLRSPKYRNPELLVTCSDCHDAHRSAGFASDLRSATGSESCGACHAAEHDVQPHVAAKLPFAHDVGVDRTLLTCTQCHMVKTATAGARVPALYDRTDPDPALRRQYYHGDHTSHRFVFTDRSYAAEQPVAATQSCASCHGEFLSRP